MLPILAGLVVGKWRDAKGAGDAGVVLCAEHGAGCIAPARGVLARPIGGPICSRKCCYSHGCLAHLPAVYVLALTMFGVFELQLPALSGIA